MAPHQALFFMSFVLRRFSFDLPFSIAYASTFHTPAFSASNTEPISTRTNTPRTLSTALQEVGFHGSYDRKKGGRSSDTRPSVVEDSKLKQYLDHIESTKHKLVLEDIERFKPDAKIDPRYSSYDQKYRELHRTLIQSFTKAQLRKFLKLYELPLLPTSSSKDTFAEMIMEKWGWEPLAKVQEERTEWKETTECCKFRGYFVYINFIALAYYSIPSKFWFCFLIYGEKYVFYLNSNMAYVFCRWYRFAKSGKAI